MSKATQLEKVCEHLPISVNLHPGSTINTYTMFTNIYVIQNTQNYKKEEKKQHEHQTRRSLKHYILASFTVAEIKLLILFCYYWITIVLLTNGIGSFIRNFDHYIDDDISAFVSCSAGGYKENCEPLAEKMIQISPTLVLNWIANIMFAFITWANLLFVVRMSDLKAWFNKLFNQCTC